MPEELTKGRVGFGTIGASIGLLFLLILVAIPRRTDAQWVQINGPYEGAVCSIAATDSFIFAGTVVGGVYRSNDSGLNWELTIGITQNSFPQCMVASGDYVYAGSSIGQGISLSTDNGATWRTINNGLPPDPEPPGFPTGVIKMLAANGSNVFTYIYPPGNFYLSTNEGSNWIDANTENISGISSIAVAGDYFIVGSATGVYVSKDSGVTWNQIGLIDSAITSLAVSDSNLYASTSRTLYLSTNQGETWSSASSGLPDIGIARLSANGKRIIANTTSGFYLSTNGGVMWSALGRVGFVPAYASPDAFIPVGTNLYFVYSDYGIYKSTNNGATWAAANTGIEEGEITALVATRNTAFAHTSTALYASSEDGTSWIPIQNVEQPLAATDSIVYGIRGGGVCYSGDGGNNWITPSNTDFDSIGDWPANLAVMGTNIFLGTYSAIGILGAAEDGIYLSTDNGASWRRTQVRGADVSLLITNGTDVYAESRAPLIVSKDTGSTWDTVTTQFLPSALAFRGAEMFGVSFGSSGGVLLSGVLHSSDEGNQWEAIDAGLPGPGQWVTCLAVHGSNVFAGTTVGVYVLDKDDTSWSAINTGLPSSSGHVNYLAATDSNLYAGFSGTVWKRPLSEIVTSVTPPSGSIPKTFLLSQNYPNPFNPSTVISYRLPFSSHVTLKIYDVLGRQIKTLVDEKQISGNHSVTFNAATLPSGVYFYRLQAGTFSQTKKLVLLK